MIDEETPENVKQNYSNTVIIVDEIHKIRNETKLYKALHKIATLTVNTKLVFMTGTPRVDKEYEILPIINLLRLNDGHTEMLSDKTIKLLFNKNISIKQQAELGKIYTIINLLHY